MGEVSVSHQPSYNIGGPEGVFIKSRILISIDLGTPASFQDALDGMHVVATFLSMAAGRAQGISRIFADVNEGIRDAAQPLSIYRSYRWRSPKRSLDTPHPSEIPIDP
ncbi:hypothetical protein [Luteibacter aegosomatissinici]|uniref:ApeA N-terminal domain 1-containing protein n=1 Tax=Luteibacter aegosomatissinici TaxID=2911539 RepID=UPI003CCDC27E